MCAEPYCISALELLLGNGGPSPTANEPDAVLFSSLQLLGSNSKLEYRGRCDGSERYKDLSAFPVNLRRNYDYTLTAQLDAREAAVDGGGCAVAPGSAVGSAAMWADWNRDGRLDPSTELLHTFQGPTMTLATFPFTVPLVTPVGSRIRVRVLTELPATLALDPCYTPDLFQDKRGAVVDFSFVIVADNTVFARFGGVAVWRWRVL